MDQEIKASALQAWRLEFDLQNPCKGGRREPSPLVCCVYMPTPVKLACVHTHMQQSGL